MSNDVNINRRSTGKLALINLWIGMSFRGFLFFFFFFFPFSVRRNIACVREPIVTSSISSTSIQWSIYCVNAPTLILTHISGSV